MFSNFSQEVLTALGGWFRPLVGRDPYNKKNVDDSAKKAEAAVDVIEKHLLTNTYLVGERITLADLFAAGTCQDPIQPPPSYMTCLPTMKRMLTACQGIISRGFQYVYGKEWRDAHPNVTRWYSTVYNQPIYSAVVDPLSFIDEAVKYTPPAKAPKPAAAPAAPKAAPKPKAKEVEEEDEEPVEAPKAKHPLAALPKPTLDLDEWKRQYSNNDTPDALKWFWANYKPEEYSLWKVDYKYNDELTQVFMT